MVELLAQLLTLLQNIVIQPLIWLFPLKWTVIYPGESGVRYTAGKPGKRLEMGCHFATTSQLLRKSHTATQVIATELVRLLTHDSIPLQVDVVVTYTICDLPVYLASSEDPTDYLMAIAEASLRSALSSHPFKDLVSNSSEIEKEIRKQIAESTKGCGIRLKHVRFQNIKHEDPYAQMICSVPASVPSLIQASKDVSKELGVNPSAALLALSQNVQPVTSLRQD